MCGPSAGSWLVVESTEMLKLIENALYWKLVRWMSDEPDFSCCLTSNPAVMRDPPMTRLRCNCTCAWSKLSMSNQEKASSEITRDEGVYYMMEDRCRQVQAVTGVGSTWCMKVTVKSQCATKGLQRKVKDTSGCTCAVKKNAECMLSCWPNPKRLQLN